MKEVQGPKVLVKIEAITIELMGALRRYPKAEKYTLGERTEKYLLAVVENIFFASFNRSRRLDQLLQARTNVQMVLFLLRVARRQSFVSDGYYEKIASDLIEVGKMLSAWIKTCDRMGSPNPGANASTQRSYPPKNEYNKRATDASKV